MNRTIFFASLTLAALLSFWSCRTALPDEPKKDSPPVMELEVVGRTNLPQYHFFAAEDGAWRVTVKWRSTGKEETKQGKLTRDELKKWMKEIKDQLEKDKPRDGRADLDETCVSIEIKDGEKTIRALPPHGANVCGAIQKKLSKIANVDLSK